MFVEFHYVFNARIQKKISRGGGVSDKYLWLPVGGRLLRPILVIILRKFKKFEILMGPPSAPDPGMYIYFNYFNTGFIGKRLLYLGVEDFIFHA